MDFEFVETIVFMKQVQEAITDEEYGLLQLELINRPSSGNLIPGGKGVRKLRWALEGKGKSGGIRILYYLYLSKHQIYMLYLFKKSEQANFKGKQLAALAEYVQNNLKE